jgi:hypothetical protein
LGWAVGGGLRCVTLFGHGVKHRANECVCMFREVPDEIERDCVRSRALPRDKWCVALSYRLWLMYLSNIWCGKSDG